MSFDTTSRNSNLALIGFVREYLDAHGIPYRISTDPAGEKANIHAIIGPQGPGGVALSGHVDTVPVDGQAWSTDPFTLRAADGRLYARGSADMKGFVSACLAAVPDMKARKLARPLHLFISYDEEVGCHGAKRLLEDIDESGAEAGAVRGGRAVGHAADPGAQGQAEPAACACAACPAIPANRARASTPSTPPARRSPMSRRKRAGSRRRARSRTGFDPPHTTIHVGTIQGGTILNIIPERCEFIMEWRTIPGDDAMRTCERMQQFVAANIEPAMHAVNPGTGFDFEVLTRCRDCRSTPTTS